MLIIAVTVLLSLYPTSRAPIQPTVFSLSYIHPILLFFLEQRKQFSLLLIRPLASAKEIQADVSIFLEQGKPESLSS